MILGVYASCISAYFGPRLIAEGLAVKFWISVGVEVLIVGGLFFALRRKETLQRRREEIDRENMEKNKG